MKTILIIIGVLAGCAAAGLTIAIFEEARREDKFNPYGNEKNIEQSDTSRDEAGRA